MSRHPITEMPLKYRAPGIERVRTLKDVPYAAGRRAFDLHDDSEAACAMIRRAAEFLSAQLRAARHGTADWTASR